MKRILVSLSTLIILMAIPSCVFFQADRPLPTVAALTWQDSIDSLNKLYNRQKLPDYLVMENPVLQGQEFDIMTVFKILDRLQMAEGHLLDYYYHHDMMGGFPVLYTRERGSQPFWSGEEFALARPECIKEGSPANQCGFIDQVETDGSELGYLQLIQLYMTGNQFYLDWHAYYNDRKPYPTAEAIDLLINRIEESSFWLPMTRTQARQARSIDPYPVVEQVGNKVNVREVWFTHWGGFYESIFLLNASPPYAFEEIKRTQLVEYDCGIRF